MIVVGYLSMDRIVTETESYACVPGGAALYAALGARMAGAEVAMVAAAGEDWPEAWTAALSARGIDMGAVVRREGETRRARLVYTAGDARHSGHHAEAAWWERTAALAPPPVQARRGDVVVAAPMPAARLARLIDEAGEARVVADTSEAFAQAEGEALRALLPRLAVFAPSTAEVAHLAGGDTASLLALCATVVEKRGREGVIVHRRGHAPVPVAAPAAVTVDATGAGDATVGALGGALAEGAEVREAARQAVLVGALCVSGAGPEALGLAWREGLR
ncbi:MAG: carbohydrate kinase family protein [Acetobacteraceae bacterium]|nr:carbohydrate kinase family protein [Acetobacteraceae bacterium]